MGLIYQPDMPRVQKKWSDHFCKKCSLQATRNCRALTTSDAPAAAGPETKQPCGGTGKGQTRKATAKLAVDLSWRLRQPSNTSQ